MCNKHITSRQPNHVAIIKAAGCMVDMCVCGNHTFLELLSAMKSNSRSGLMVSYICASIVKGNRKKPQNRHVV